MDTKRKALYGIRIQIYLTDMLLPSFLAHMRCLLQCILQPVVMTVTGAELACPLSLGAEESPITFSRGSSSLYRLFSKAGLWGYPI